MMSISKRVAAIIIGVLLLCIIDAAGLLAGTAYQLTFSSRYTWRGFEMNPPNKPVLQPSITYTFGESGFSANAWGSFSFENKELNELDLTLSYSFASSEHVSLAVGFIHYGWYFAEGFRFEDNTTQEVYVSAGLPKVFLSPRVSFYYDFNNGDGYYLLLGVGHSLPVSGRLSLELAASCGYNGKQWIEESGFSDLNLGASLPLKINKFTVTPFLNVTFILLDAVNPGVDNEISFGAAAAF